MTHENITYRLEEQGWVATKLNGTAPELLLFPDMIGDEIIYKIGGNFCGEQTTLRRVTFPRHLREIGDSAFSNVGIAGELRLPETVTAIRHAAFAHNRNITKIIFPPKLEILEQSAFQNTLGLEKVELPETLKHFGDRVFCGTNLDQTHFRMPKCVTRSDKRYYWYLGEKIQTIEIPSISHFQYDAITLQGTARGSLTLQFNSPTVEMDTNAIRLYLSRHQRVTLQFREGAHVTLHENFAYGDGQQMSAFPSRNCRLAVRIGNKESVWDGARFVGEASFIYAGRNTTDSIDHRFTLTNNNTTFHRLHDKECKHFDVPKGIREIKSEAFIDTVCESLSLPRELNRLETAAFKGMEKLKTITLPASINWSESHYDWLFDLCFNLERIIIHSSLPKWEIGMFAKCRKLKYIVLAGNQSTQPTFVEKPLWDEEKLCKPVHVILFTQQDPQEANSTVQNVQVLKLALNKKDYEPVANEIADSVAKIVSAYNARSDRPPFLTHLIPELDKLFQVTAPVEDQSKSDARTEPSVSPRVTQVNVIRAGETFSRGATVTHENVTYQLDEQGWVATKLNGTAPAALVFPNRIGDKNIYKIGDNFCGEQTTLRHVTFPRYLREIGEAAFSNVGLAGELHLPEMVTAIRRVAFAHNRNITKIIFPPKLEILEQSAFQNTENLEKVELPETLKHYGDRVFCGTILDQTHFRIPRCVTRSDGRFYWFLGETIKTIEIPSVSHFQTNAIQLHGTGKGELTLQFNSPKVEIDNKAICVYFPHHRKVTLQFREGAEVNLRVGFIHGDGQPMSKFAEHNCRLAVRIGDKESIWDGIQFIGDADITYAGIRTTGFSYAVSENYTIFHRLHDIKCKHFNLPQKTVRIKGKAFTFTACESISLPNTLKYLETCSFQRMEQLKTITLPASINWEESTYDWLFDLCFNLERIIIHSSLPEWQNGMFAKCRKLKYIVLAGNQSTQPTFDGYPPLRDIEKLCKPVHVILFTQQDPQQANSKVQDVQVLKLAPGKKDYEPVANEIADSVAKIVSAYNARADRPPFLTHLIPELDALFQVTAPVEDQPKPSPTTQTAKPKPVALKPSSTPKTAKPKPTQEDVKDINDPGMEGWLPIDENPKSTNKTSADNPSDSHAEEELTSSPTTEKSTRKRLGVFSVESSQKELRIVKCNQATGSVTLPRSEYPGQRVVVEADAFANCQLLILEVLHNDVTFKANALRDARIKNILFFDRAPVFTILAFNGILGDFPECQIYTNGIYEPAFVSTRALRFLRPDPDKPALFLFDYGESQSKALSIPESFNHNRRRHKLYLLPGAFKNCPNLETISLAAPNWTTPDVFKDISKLNKITVPRAHATEAKKLQRELEGTDIMVNFR